MNPSDFEIQRLKVKVTINKSANNYVNSVEIKLFSVFWLNLAQIQMYCQRGEYEPL